MSKSDATLASVSALFDNLILTVAVLVSLVFHALLLVISFVMPAPVVNKPADQGLEVVLVNSKHAKRPSKAEVLAQADLDGGGNHEQGRAKSPLPDSNKSNDGDSITQKQKQVAELEQLQQQLLEKAGVESQFKTPKNKKNDKERVATDNGKDQQESQTKLDRMAAEISQTIEDQNKRPRKTYITPSSQRVGYAIYYKSLQKRIEDVGTINFPQHDGKKLYGELTVYIPIFQDGTIYEKEGGPRIEKSSGNKDLDQAALRIVRMAAPFGKFPPNMRSTDKDDLWVVISRFRFTREQHLETELRGGR